MGDYPNIADHGLIGDLQTAALVDTNGTIDWFCCPRFDSPSVFASLLDAERGGFCRIAPTRRLRHAPALPAGHRDPHHPVHDRGGRGRGGRLHADRRRTGDRPPPAGAPASRRPRLDAVRRRDPAPLRLRPRVAHDRARPRRRARMFSPTTCRSPCTGSATRCPRSRARRQIEPSATASACTGSLNAGESTGIMLETGGAEPRRIPHDEMYAICSQTRDFWRGWLDRSTYRGDGARWSPARR